MTDELQGGLLKDGGLRILVVTAHQLGSHVEAIHRTHETSTALLTQALAAAALMGALQKGGARVNLQLECDGPMRGLFAEADTEGHVRGYVKNGQLDVHGAPGEFEWRPALGNSGFLSVLRDRGEGDFYRSAVELRHFNISSDLEHFFESSEQLETYVQLFVRKRQRSSWSAAGVLVQPLPDGDRALLRELKASSRPRVASSRRSSRPRT
jgi:molecular chaperone Hsp33